MNQNAAFARQTRHADLAVHRAKPPTSSKARQAEANPSVLRVVDPSAWRNGSKITRCRSAVSPMPVSVTVNRKIALLGRLRSVIRSVTSMTRTLR